jgi:hypothetical protein
VLNSQDGFLKTVDLQDQVFLEALQGGDLGFLGQKALLLVQDGLVLVYDLCFCLNDRALFPSDLLLKLVLDVTCSMLLFQLVFKPRTFLFGCKEPFLVGSYALFVALFHLGMLPLDLGILFVSCP